MRLLHRTCDHGMKRISQDMTLRPLNVSYRGLIWLSDLDQCDPRAIGLTSFMLRCNRMEWVCEVDTGVAVPWTKWAHDNKVPLHVRLALDHVDGAMPLHWWVSELPLDVIDIRKGT